MRKRSSDRQEHRSIVVSGSDRNSGGRRKPEASSSSADSTAESASAIHSYSKLWEIEGKKQTKKRIEITVPHKDGMEALYDTVDGLTVEKGSYIAVVAKDLSAGSGKP